MSEPTDETKCLGADGAVEKCCAPTRYHANWQVHVHSLAHDGYLFRVLFKEDWDHVPALFS